MQRIFDYFIRLSRIAILCSPERSYADTPTVMRFVQLRCLENLLPSQCSLLLAALAIEFLVDYDAILAAKRLAVFCAYAICIVKTVSSITAIASEAGLHDPQAACVQDGAINMKRSSNMLRGGGNLPAAYQPLLSGAEMGTTLTLALHLHNASRYKYLAGLALGLCHSVWRPSLEVGLTAWYTLIHNV